MNTIKILLCIVIFAFLHLLFVDLAWRKKRKKCQVSDHIRPRPLIEKVNTCKRDAVFEIYARTPFDKKFKRLYVCEDCAPLVDYYCYILKKTPL